MTPDFSFSQGLRRPPLGRRLRLGFVGGGRGGLVGQWHFSGARLSNHWDVMAGALSTDPANASVSGEDWCLAPDRSYSDWREMLRAEAARPDGIEAVAICTPNHTHFEIAKGFIEAGFDVIVDKPMTFSTDEAEELCRLQEATGRVVAVTYSFAHHAMVRQATEMVVAGMLGEIRQAHVEYVQEWSVAPDDPANKGAAWRRNPALVGRASATGDIGTHAYHLLKTVSGLDISSLRADFHVCGAPKALEDTAFVNFKLTNGAPGILWVTQAAPGNHCALRIRLFGEKASLSWDQEFPEHLKFAPFGEPEQILMRGKANGILPAAARLSHLPRGHGEALTDAWSNLYAEVGVAIAARRAGVTLDDGAIHYTGPKEGLAGVRFVETCAQSHEAGGAWTDLS